METSAGNTRPAPASLGTIPELVNKIQDGPGFAWNQQYLRTE